MGTVTDKLNKVYNTKQAIKQALIDKGVEIKDTDTFASYPDKITSIQTGGGGDYWEQIGYPSAPKYIDDGVQYAQTIYDNWDASITNRYNAFKGDTKLMYFPLVDTSNAVNMNNMFDGCKNLQYIPAINTSNVTSMSVMFKNCSGLTSLDLSSFDTSNVTTMNNMFNSCYSLTSLDLSSFDTSNVTTMVDMFSYCKNLTSLDLSNFDTSNVNNMNNMFCNCSGLTSLNVSSFDTSNVTIMNNMFYGCSGLTSLNVSNFDTSNVTTMSYMFGNCYNLTSLDLSSFDTSNVTNMNYMFSYNYKLSRIDGSINWNKISSYPSSFITSNSSNGYSLRYMVIKNIGTTGTTFNFNTNNLQNWGDNTDAIPDARQSLVDTFVTHTYDRASNGMGSCTIQLYSTIKARLTSDEIAQITAKGFTVT